MFSLLYGLWKILWTKAQYNVLIIGLDNAGKTTMLEQMRVMYSNLPGTRSVGDMKIPPTVGLNIGRFDANRNSKMVIWDLGGQAGLRVLWEKYFADAHAVIYVVDGLDKERIAESRSELEKILADPDLQGAPLLLMLNKQDLSNTTELSNIAKQLHLEVTDRKVKIQPSSGLNGHGVKDGLEWLLEVLPELERTQRLAQTTDT